MERLIFKALSSEAIFDAISENPRFKNEVTQEQVDETIHTMVELGDIISSVDADEEEVYRLSPNFARDRTQLRLKMKLIQSHLKQAVVHYLLETTNRLWTICLDAQKTKTAQMIRVIREFLSSALEDPDSGKVVPVLFLLNSLELREQTVVRFIRDILSRYEADLFIFSSGKSSLSPADPLANRVFINHPPRFLELSIDAFASGRSPHMPIVITLPNKTQLTKVKRSVYEEVQRRHSEGLDITHCTLIDEADEVYPQIRDAIKSYLVVENGPIITATHENAGTYYTTASHEDFINKYPEVKSAEQIPIILDEGVDENYRSLNHPDAKYPVSNLLQTSKESNGTFARRVLDHYWQSHFSQGVRGQGRKVIIHADFENSKQKELARYLAGTYCAPCIVVNQNGFTLIWRGETGVVERSVKKCREFAGKSLNEKLLYLYQQNPELRAGTLTVIGHKKLDRALSYHCAPRDPTDMNALIFTDIVVGYISKRNRAIQVLGRIYGVIGHHPMYCGNLWFWVDQRTKECVLRNSRIQAEIQRNSFIPRSIVDLHDYAASVTPDVAASIGRDIRQLGPFDTLEEAERIATHQLGKGVHTAAFKSDDQTGGYHISTRLTQHWSNVVVGAVGNNIETYTALNRIVLERQTEGVYPHRLDQIPLTVSVNTYKGVTTTQNFVIIPVYQDETVTSTESPKYILRYEEPVRDSTGRVIFVGKRVKYNDALYKIKSVEPSINGIPSRVTLEDSAGNTLMNGEVENRVNGNDVKLLA